MDAFNHLKNFSENVDHFTSYSTQNELLDIIGKFRREREELKELLTEVKRMYKIIQPTGGWQFVDDTTREILKRL